MKIVFIGGGTIAKAIYKGLQKEHDIVVVKRNLEDEFWKGDVELKSPSSEVESDVYIIAVKPFVYKEALEPFIGKDGVFISVMAGITIDMLNEYLGNDDVVRCMPNLPVSVGKGYVPYSVSSDKAEEVFVEVFDPLGHLEATEEEYINALTALTGTSPLYISVFIDALLDSGIKIGLPRELVKKAVVQCTMGGSKYLEAENIHPMELKDMVSSPAGTSIHALHNLEKSGVKAAIIEAVEIAYNRSKKLQDLREI